MTVRSSLLGALLLASLPAAPAGALSADDLLSDETVAGERRLVPPGQEVESGELPPLDAAPAETADPPTSSPGDAGPDTGEAEDGDVSDGDDPSAARADEAPETDAPGTDAAEAQTEPSPEPRYDLESLPRPVARMRELLLEAARSGSVERVALLAGVGEEGAQLSLVPEGRDAATILREESGDGEGYETLAILAEVLEAGYVVLDPGEETELYLWPWFAAASIDELTPEETVAMFRVLTAADRDAMEEFGAYVFYRLGIDRDGVWRFFVAGD